MQIGKRSRPDGDHSSLRVSPTAAQPQGCLHQKGESVGRSSALCGVTFHAEGFTQPMRKESAEEDWTVVDLGSFHNEGELLVAADDRLAELLEWPSAQETTLLRWQSRPVGSAGDSSQLQVLIRRLAGVPPL
jgi:hypothetical protein